MNFFKPKAAKLPEPSTKPEPKFCPNDGCPLTKKEYVTGRVFSSQTGEGLEHYIEYLNCKRCTWEYKLVGKFSRPVESKCADYTPPPAQVSSQAMRLLIAAWKDSSKYQYSSYWKHGTDAETAIREITDLKWRYG